MARFLLIHGSCHGAWCWRDVLPLLRKQGHDSQAIDLPSHGDDTTPLADVTLDLYAQAILDAVTKPAVLVGHSMAGFPITLAAELAPEKISKLVYLCAYVPTPGKSLVEMRKAAPRQFLADAIVTAPDRRSFTIDPAKACEKFYHDCSKETVAYAMKRLVPQAIQPQATPINCMDNVRKVEAHYILCEKDQTIPPEYQESMSADFPRSHVTCLPTSHSPFFAAPAKLAETLIQIAEAS